MQQSSYVPYATLWPAVCWWFKAAGEPCVPQPHRSNQDLRSCTHRHQCNQLHVFSLLQTTHTRKERKMAADHQPPTAAPTAPAALVSATQVAEIVKENKQGVAVVDVRDAQEFASGHVKGALNLSSTAFSSTDAVDQLIQQLESKSQVVVHCAQSLQRGPASAAALRARLQELGIPKEVVVMEGGFNKFGELYSGDSSVVETGPAAAPPAAGGTTGP